MNIKKSNLYLRDLSKLKVNLDLYIEKCLTTFIQNPNYPSLHNKHIKCKHANNLYSLRVNKQYRILYLKYDEYIELYRLLEHDKYDRLTKSC